MSTTCSITYSNLTRSATIKYNENMNLSITNADYNELPLGILFKANI